MTTIGHGEVFSRIINKDLLINNTGTIGLIGVFSITLISLISSYFVTHNFVYIIILHSIFSSLIDTSLAFLVISEIVSNSLMLKLPAICPTTNSV